MSCVIFGQARRRRGVDCRLGCLDCLHQEIGAEGLGPLDGQAEGTGPDVVGEDAEGSGDAEQHGVVVHLVHAVVLEQDTGVGVHVGPGVLDLAGLQEDRRHDFVDLRHQLWTGRIRALMFTRNFFKYALPKCTKMYGKSSESI